MSSVIQASFISKARVETLVRNESQWSVRRAPSLGVCALSAGTG